jgi:hypothetical protein
VIAGPAQPGLLVRSTNDRMLLAFPEAADASHALLVRVGQRRRRMVVFFALNGPTTPRGGLAALPPARAQPAKPATHARLTTRFRAISTPRLGEVGPANDEVVGCRWEERRSRGRGATFCQVVDSRADAYPSRNRPSCPPKASGGVFHSARVCQRSGSCCPLLACSVGRCC